MTPVSVLSALADHIWQSTALAACIWLLTLALRKNSARLRHCLWFAASAKFLVPLSLLIGLGASVRPAAPERAAGARSQPCISADY